MKRCRWVKPAQICQIKFSEWTRDGKLRQPVFLGLRDDKDASEVVRDGLRLLELQQRDRDAAHSALKKKLRLAAANADSGAPVDGEEFIAKLLDRLRRDSENSGIK